MDDVILKELKRVVEQAVRPVRATLARKRRMREELLAHLTAIFEEESETLGNDQAALDHAERRFGDPRQLTGQLQETVPRWDRLARLGDTAERRPNESLLRFAGRIAMFSLMFSVPPVLILLPLVCVCGRQNEAAIRAYVLFCIAIFNIPLTLGVILLADGMYRALYQREGVRSWRLAAAYGLVSVAFFPVLAFAWYWLLTGDMAASCGHLLFACRFAPLAPLVFAAMARQVAGQMRHDEEWASLAIQQ